MCVCVRSRSCYLPIRLIKLLLNRINCDCYRLSGLLTRLRRDVMNSFHVTLKPGLPRRPVTAKFTPVRLLALVNGRDVNGEVILLTESLLAELTGIGTMFFVDRLDVFLEMVFAFETVRADRAYVGLRAVGLFVNRRLMRLHDVSAEMVTLQEALIAQVTPVRLDLLSVH